MTVKKEQEGAVENGVEKYELRAPDGGWGYVIVFATIVVFNCTVIPMAAFGLIFGGFLRSIGDETTGTTLSNGMFNTVQSFTGLIANGALNRYSYRKVGFAGIIIFFLGTTGLIFSYNLFQIVTFFGVIQGLGFGLMTPAVLSAFNSYFTDKMAVMMSIAQGVMVIVSMIVPMVATWSMELFGYRGTLIGLAGLVLLGLPAMATLQPVQRHMKKIPVRITNINDTVLAISSSLQDKMSLPSDVLKSQIKPLLNQDKHLAKSQNSLNERVQVSSIHPKPRRSIISMGDRVASVTTINNLKDNENDVDKDISKKEEFTIWQTFIKSMDMSLLKDPKYINVSLGLALCFTGDVAFLSIIPVMLGNAGFESQQIALIITAFFGSDLVGRIIFTVISGIFKLRSRIVILFAALFSAIFRIALVFNDTYMWKICIIAVLGFLRTFIHTPLPLVISEEYSDKFATAFSLYMAVNGVVSLVFGLLMSVIKSYTHSDVMVCHTLTVAFSICVIAWTSEMTLFRRKSQNEQKK